MLDLSGTARTADYTWTYDDAGRLTQEKYDDDHDNSLDYEAFYTYDLTGNRLKKEVDTDLNTTIDETTTYTYNNADQLLTETTIIGSVDSGVAVDDLYTVYTYTGTLQTGKAVYMKYDYDNVSGTSPTTETTYEFNLQGRMSKVIIDVYSGGNISSQEITEFTYDPAGQRVESHHTKDTNYDSSLEVDETTTYLNDPDNFSGLPQVLQEVTYDNLAQAETDRKIYTLGHDLLAQFTKNATYTSGLNTVFLYDGHGSTRALTTMAGELALHNSVEQLYKYDAFGTLFALALADALTTYLYSGEPLDTNIGKQYLDARWLDLETGLFNRLDPYFGNLKDPQSFHKYLYTHADPVNGIDPTGLRVWGLKPWIAELGDIAHMWISGLYALEHPVNVTYDQAIPRSRGRIRPDIMDYQLGQIGEIKPLSDGGLLDGPRQANAGVNVANGIPIIHKGRPINNTILVPHNGPQKNWIHMTWQPGTKVFYAGWVSPIHARTLLYTLGTLNGVTYYHHYRLPDRLRVTPVVVAVIQEALEKMAANIAEEFRAGVRDLKPAIDLIYAYRLEAVTFVAIGTYLSTNGQRFVSRVNALRLKTMSLRLGFGVI